MEERRNGTYYCDICDKVPASEIKGGKYNNERKVWFVCKECKLLIDDKRDKNG
uniref:Uncharacterized protein n=1 Tax=viral metagenome TaxID=1070528 RepID=A0A6M3KF38_9ZZZZ